MRGRAQSRQGYPGEMAVSHTHLQHGRRGGDVGGEHHWLPHTLAYRQAGMHRGQRDGKLIIAGDRDRVIFTGSSLGRGGGREVSGHWTAGSAHRLERNNDDGTSQEEDGEVEEGIRGTAASLQSRQTQRRLKRRHRGARALVRRGGRGRTGSELTQTADIRDETDRRRHTWSAGAQRGQPMLHLGPLLASWSVAPTRQSSHCTHLFLQPWWLQGGRQVLRQ